MKYDTILHNYNMHKKIICSQEAGVVEVHIDKSGQPSKSRKPHPLLQIFLDRKTEVCGKGFRVMVILLNHIS